MTAPSAAPLGTKLNVRLSLMMFLQYAIWGAWLPIFFDFLTKHRNFTDGQAGQLFGIAAIGALVAPFIAGQIADRWFATEKFLGISHLVGAALMWQLGSIESFNAFIIFGLLYSLIYAPTLSLTNSLALHHIPDRDRDFGTVRKWGTIGWIVVGIGIGQWLLRKYTPEGVDDALVSAARNAGKADAFKLSAVLGALMGLYCFTLPHTPPVRSTQQLAWMSALRAVGKNPLLTLFLVAFPVSCVHQFYFARTAGFLDHLEVRSSFIDGIFGVGGGPMTIGQIAEIVVLGLMPMISKRVSRKTVLTVGLLAYIARFAVFAYLPQAAIVYPALALHGLCFGCFFFVCFMIVDEETSSDVRASAQSLFNLVIVGLGVIAGNLMAGKIGDIATTKAGTDFEKLFSIPMWITVGCLVIHLLFYPRKSRAATS